MPAQIYHITTLEMPELLPYLTLKEQQNHYDLGIFVAEGNRVVERMIQSECYVVSLLVASKKIDLVSGWLESKPYQVPVYYADEKLLSDIVGFRFHNGFMAVAKIPESPPLEKICACSGRKIFVALDNLAQVENAGVISRNCAATGVGAILTGETSVSPYFRRAVRNSMGNLFKIPVIKCKSLKNDLLALKSFGFRIMGAYIDSTSIPLHTVNTNENVCVVLGNEYTGISDDIISVCDERIIIPMADGVDSYNVACASALVLYELTRGRFKIRFE